MQLALPNLPPRAYELPAVDLNGARGFLPGATEDEIRDLIDCGFLWAWDVSIGRRIREGQFQHRMFWRILTDSVKALPKDARADTITKFSRFPAEWDQVLQRLLPRHEKPWLTGPEIKAALNLDRSHFQNLVAAGHLAQFGNSAYRKGPGGYPLIDRNSFTHFLRTRVAGGL